MNYTTSIDLGEGYFEVFLVIPEFTKELQEGEMFLRYKWGKIDIRNNPDLFAQTGNDAYKLYDLIYGLQFNDVVKIKVEYQDVTIQGIFSANKCEYKHDITNKVLQVTPKTLDKYTNFLDNIENEIDILSGESTSQDNNLIRNGAFDNFLNINADGVQSNPQFWTWHQQLNNDFGVIWEQLPPIREVLVFRNNNPLVKLYDTQTSDYFWQRTEKIITKGQDIFASFRYNNVYYENDFDFYYDNIPGYTDKGKEARKEFFRNKAFALTYKRRYRLSIVKKIEYWEAEVQLWWDSVNNTWSETDVINFYKEDADIVLSPDELSELKEVNIYTTPVPFDCTVIINFLVEKYIGGWLIEGNPNRRGYLSTSLILDDIKIYADTSKNKPIFIPLSTENIQRKQPFSLLKDCLRADVFLDRWVNDANKDTRFYFTNEGRPNQVVLEQIGTNGYGWRLSHENKSIQDWEDGFMADDTSGQKYDLYRGQLCELTIYEGEYYPEWTTIRAKQRIFAEATFAREEYWKVDVMLENGDFEPPVLDAGWKRVGIPNGIDRNKKLWVRTPYNGQYNDWQMDVEETFGEWHVGNPNGFKCQKKRTSRRIYPSIETPIEVKNGIDLRDVFRAVFHVTHPDYANKEVLSNFLWNSNEADIPLLANQTGMNYVTMQPNFFNNITCVHTMALRTLDTALEEDNSRLVFSFKTFFDDFRNYFKKYNYGELYYDIDDSLNLVIEHVKYIDYLATSIDVRDKLLRPNYMFSYDATQLRSKLKYTQEIAGYKDFTNNIMEFDSITGDNNTEVITFTSKLLTTDVRYCVENPNDLKNGLVLINHENNVALFAPVQLAKISEVNGNMALSSLLDKFGRYEGTWITGRINGEVKYFDNILRVKKGEQITLKGIVDHPFMTTHIGHGFVITMIHDFNKNITKVTLVYKTEFALMATKYLASENEVSSRIYLKIT